ncbi:hypothetical protein [Cellulomonas soli]
MSTVDALATAVEDALEDTEQLLARFLAERTAHARTTAPVCGALWTDLGNLVGGKLIRPRLTIAAYLGLGVPTCAPSRPWPPRRSCCTAPCSPTTTCSTTTSADAADPTSSVRPAPG